MLTTLSITTKQISKEMTSTLMQYEPVNFTVSFLWAVTPPVAAAAVAAAVARAAAVAAEAVPKSAAVAMVLNNEMFWKKILKNRVLDKTILNKF